VSLTTIFRDTTPAALPHSANTQAEPDPRGCLARVATLDAQRMAESLQYLSLINPAAFNAILAATAPCADDDPPAEETPESYCQACHAPVAAFTSQGGDLLHYDGDPLSDNIEPYLDNHAPVLT
jgi:hypothetical protein